MKTYTLVSYLTGIYDIDYNTVENYNMHCTEVYPLYRSCRNYMKESYQIQGAESEKYIKMQELQKWMDTPVKGLNFGSIESSEDIKTFVLYRTDNLPDKFRRG